jgi:hypothetical protein
LRAAVVACLLLVAILALRSWFAPSPPSQPGAVSTDVAVAEFDGTQSEAAHLVSLWTSWNPAPGTSSETTSAAADAADVVDADSAQSGVDVVGSGDEFVVPGWLIAAVSSDVDEEDLFGPEPEDVPEVN